MTDNDTGHGEPATTAAKRPSITQFTQIGAAAVSLALIAGIGVWGYGLVVRDVHGVPVVRAAEGVSRIQPENPGGRPAAHQGLSVNVVAGTGTAAPPPERLVLAPRAVTLTDEDRPQAELAARAAEQAPPASGGEAPSPALLALADQIAGDARPLAPLADAGASEVRVSLGGVPRTPDETGDDRVAPAAASSTDAGEEAAEADPAAESDPSPEAVSIAAAAGVPARSLRPQARPQALRTASLAPGAAAAPSADEAVPEADPASLPAGTRLVQLGAYESADVARREWARLDARFEAYLEGKTRVVQRAQSGGRTFWRLRAMGFEDLADARRFCATLMAEGADCIPVVTR
ncbi:SPOR domain-containing protein [Rhodosalinus halophilus]|uniref:SPOR domain-containing protein n=1 Tax=Rhodosalinus halophilus TaxID=2259333 RepID=A0A365U6D5_9RHOB|nr:SPOR domain-containing protein [Rhodosalinus halophilus]RBI84077.1 SPOR domain-containing protein [Rhodosalinus halophilus]